MNKSELRQIIKEEIKNTLNEASAQGLKITHLFWYLNAEDVEYFFRETSKYYEYHASELDNMDAKGIAKDLKNAYEKIKKRTGN